MIKLDISILYILGLFLLLVFILNRYFFKPLLKILEERRAMVVGPREEAQRSLKEVEELTQQREKALASTTAESKQLKDERIQEGRQEGDKIIASTRTEAERLLFSAEKEIKGMVREVEGDLEGMSGNFAHKIAESLLGRRLPVSPADKKGTKGERPPQR
ncbi:MAG: ATP synthase F0 subunit B [Acidobacteriota bacterium]